VRVKTSRLVDFVVGGARWQVVAECRELLFGPDGLRLSDWLRAGRAQVIKDAPHRTVYRVTLPGLAFYLKHYRLVGLRAWLRQLFRPAKARMEWDRALAVGRRHISTVVPLGLGEKRPGSGESFLITRSLEDAEPLSTFIEVTLPLYDAGRRSRVRQRLACALGEFMAALHEAGIVHHDLHAANLLVRVEAMEYPQLYLIDLHALSLRRSLAWRTSRDNLVVLNRWFVLRASRTDRQRFWRAYCRCRQNGTRMNGRQALYPLRELARELEKRTWRSNWHFWQRRRRRCLATNRRYYRFHSAAGVGNAVRDVEPTEVVELFRDPDAPFARPGATLLKDSRSSTVAEFDLPINGRTCRVIYKRFRVTNWMEPWTALLRRTPALRSWLNGHSLRDRVLPTARPLAVFHRRRWGLSYEGYLLTERIANAADLHSWLAALDTVSASARRATLHHRIDQIATLIRELHRRGLSHRDLKANNLLVADDVAWVIDLVGVTSRGTLSRSRRVQNLARLNASFWQDRHVTCADKLRFLRVYLQWGLRGRHGWKRWWSEIAKATQDKVKRNLHNGRPLA
jgi:tRNA A-37 threonylcarbamoyl transferase component Bud32